MLINRRTILLSILVIIVTAGIIASGCSIEWKPSQLPETGEVAADFQLEDLEGNSIALSGYHGRPVLLNFWATWCNPCREEIPLLETLHNDARWQDEDLVIIAIDIGENRSTVRNFVDEYGISFTVLLDTERNVFRQYFVQGVPTTYFIDRKGIIQAVTIGGFTSVKEIEKNLKKILYRS